MAQKRPRTIPAPSVHPVPPAGLPELSCELWRAIVAEYPPDHFGHGANLALLENFVRAAGFVRECDRLIEERGLLLLGDKPNPAVRMRNAGWNEMRATAAKLRLPISSLMRAESKAARPDPKHALSRPWED